MLIYSLFIVLFTALNKIKNNLKKRNNENKSIPKMIIYLFIDNYYLLVVFL